MPSSRRARPRVIAAAREQGPPASATGPPASAGLQTVQRLDERLLRCPPPGRHTRLLDLGERGCGDVHKYVWANYKWVEYAFGCAHCNPWWEWHLNHFQGHQVELTRARSPWIRNSGQLQTYGFTLSFADYLSLQDLATYGSITSMTYSYQSGCSGKRLLWGNGTDPASAPIGQASCV